MPHLFFTSDEHYDHNNIIRFCNRPYANTNEMRRDLIARHNARVTPGMAEHSLTWHLGDMFWNTMSVHEADSIMYALNGSHSFLFGNHDELIENNLDWAKKWFKEIAQYKFLKSNVGNRKGLFLCHYATRIWPGSHRGSWHMYGHSHGEVEELGQSFDVGVDSVGKLGLTPYSPASLDEVRRLMEKRKRHHTMQPDSVWKGQKNVSELFATDHLPEGSH